jgi:GAF domain-containing protein/anti-sigma regulatory factor (Ser/Thr protein kinase)
VKQAIEAGAGQTVAELEQRLAAVFAERDELLQQQAASAEILKVINASRGNLGPVFEIILEKAHSLCDVPCGSLQLYDGDYIRAVAVRGMTDAFEKALRQGYRITERIRQDMDPKQVMQIVDLAEILARMPDERQLRVAVEVGGIRTRLSVPLVKDGVVLGRIVAARQEVRPFTDKQIALLQGFADQAVIAIENARLLTEQREALEQQTATAEVLKVISRSTFDLQSVLDALLASAARLCEAEKGAIFKREGDLYHWSANFGNPPELIAFAKANPFRAGRHAVTARVALEGKTCHVPDVLADPEYGATQHQKLGGHRTFLGVPLLREGSPIGVFALTRSDVRPFTPKQVELVETFADQAVIAIENVRLFNETKEALEQQTATAEILKVISRSAFDLNAVFEALIASAAKLCEAERCLIFLRDGDAYRPTAGYGVLPEFRAFMDQHPIVPGRGTIIGRALLERKTVHVGDILQDKEFLFRDEVTRIGDWRSILAVPLLREGEPVGALGLTRRAAGLFTDRQIELVQTFADQAVIAIENVRLFDEVQTRTRDLSESLMQQTATADVLKVISRSAFDLQAVLDTLVASAGQLCSADGGIIWLRKDDLFHASAAAGYSDQQMAFFRDNPRSIHDKSLAPRVLRSRRTEHIPDRSLDPEFAFPGMSGLPSSMLGVPLLRDDRVEGVFTLSRINTAPFTPRQIELVESFADQSVIAIENARLFNEVEARTRELSASLDDLRAAQDRLVQTEKLASLGQLTAGIAHEIKNPLNFVNNFSALSAELVGELDEALAPAALDQKTRGDVSELTGMLKSNLEKVVQHGKRADSIVKNMLLHSREGSGEHRPADINAIVDESLNLAYHGARAERPSFNITLRRELDPDAGLIEVYPQEITRVLLNLISNGFYAANKRKEAGDGTFEPALSATTKCVGNAVEIRIRDNGMGIPLEVKEKMFNPFFTTKPAGEGTGLGLSMSHDIVVKQHGGTIDVNTEAGVFTEFIITLPRNRAAQPNIGGKN